MENPVASDHEVQAIMESKDTQDGIHPWTDSHGNHGYELQSHRVKHINVVRTRGLFDVKNPFSIFDSTTLNQKNRRALVLTDDTISDELDTVIRAYFASCKTRGELDNFNLVSYCSASNPTIEDVLEVVKYAKNVPLRRRDVFIAIGGHKLTNTVGFAAAIYRRSTALISIPTDPIAVMQCHNIHSKVSVSYVTQDEKRYNGLLALPHLAETAYFDPDLLQIPGCIDEILCELVTMIRVAISQNEALFHYLAIHAREMLHNPGSQFHPLALELATQRNEINRQYDYHKSEDCDDLEEFAEPAIRAVTMAHCGHVHERSTIVAMGIALTIALSYVKGILNNIMLKRMLNIFARVGLQIHCATWIPLQLWKEFTSGNGCIAMPESLSSIKSVSCHDLTLRNFEEALSLLERNAPLANGVEDDLENGEQLVNGPASNSVKTRVTTEYRVTKQEIVRYIVARVSDILDVKNPAMLQDFSTDSRHENPRRLLIVVDDYQNCPVSAITRYFQEQSSRVGPYKIRFLHFESFQKDMTGVSCILDAAVELKMSSTDLFVVLGGGTLMDIVGFTAAMYRGGTSYIKIPTTLVGMIDAGIAVKVGVNFQNHKSLLGRYFAPVACLNDPGTFLGTLAKVEVACGLAEAIKMAIVKDAGFFRRIEMHHQRREMSLLMPELIDTSVYLMLQELQPNLEEHQLRRLADFGHEFGHIIESTAEHRIPHGQCVSIGMAISAGLAKLRGMILQDELHRILTLLCELQLPIYVADHDSCCDPAVLWSKISKDGLKHKHGMLYLVVPRSIGNGEFLDYIEDISYEMIREIITELKEFSEIYRQHRAISTSSTLHNHPQSAVTTIAISAASSNIGLEFIRYCSKRGFHLICSVRSTAMERFRKKMDSLTKNMSVLAGDIFDLDNLRTMLRRANVYINMAGIVSLSTKAEDFSKVLAVNGFAQGIVTFLITELRRTSDIKVIFPSTQRVDLTAGEEVVSKWIDTAITTFNNQLSCLLQSKDLASTVQQFAANFLDSNPLPSGRNVYELSKCLGEGFVAQLPRHCLMRISSVYGPSYTRGLIYRACHPKLDCINVEEEEIRDFIFNDDLMELMLEMTNSRNDDLSVLNACSGSSTSTQQVWQIISEIDGRLTPVRFNPKSIQETMQPDPGPAQLILRRSFVPINVGLRRTIVGYRAHTSIGDEGPQLLAYRKPFIRWQQSLYNLPRQPQVLVVDIGASCLRLGVINAHGELLEATMRVPMLPRQSSSEAELERIQETLMESITAEIRSLMKRITTPVDCIAIALGAVVTSDGILHDASILYGTPAQGQDIIHALQQRLPSHPVMVMNDISAAAWRYKDHERFCLITVSSGLSNKVFNMELKNTSLLDLDVRGIGGEMGHVIIEPRKVDQLVQTAINRAMMNPGEYLASLLHTLTDGDASRITAQELRTAALQNDKFTMELLMESDVPCCACGNLADLCSYSSGRAALTYAKQQAGRGIHDVYPDMVTNEWLKDAIASAHPLAIETLERSTYSLALRILQLAADIGLDKFIIVGGYAEKTGGTHFLHSLQTHLLRMCHSSGYFRGWTPEKIRSLVSFGCADDNDALIGVGLYAQYCASTYVAVEKAIGSSSLSLVTRPIPRCGGKEVLVKPLYTGICTTDLQMLSNQRPLEPIVLGHEGVSQVVGIGKHVHGLKCGDLVVINPNNPLDDFVKIGHNTEGLFQRYFKFGTEYIERKQVLVLEQTIPKLTDALIEPLSCIVAALRRVEARIRDKNVLIVGAGVMGQMFVETTRSFAARGIYLTNRSQARLDYAIKSGIILREHTLRANEPIHHELDAVTDGQGVDMVIICVSMNEGLEVTRSALEYVNEEGCIYFFAGFGSQDILDLPHGEKIDIFDIRSRWKTTEVSFHGKVVSLSGHRGSTLEDLASASRIINKNQQSFKRFISHTISLDTLPEVICPLMENGCIRGTNARRVVIDMGAPAGTVEFARDTAWRHLQEAAKRSKHNISLVNLFREIGFDGESSMLGWVKPQSWSTIEKILARAIHMPVFSNKRHIVFCGTGSWTFLVNALKRTTPTNGDIVLHTLRSLDAKDIGYILGQINDPSEALFIGVSQSCKTIETLLLMNTMRDWIQPAGLRMRDHFLWISDIKDPAGTVHQAGLSLFDATIEHHEWEGVPSIQMTLDGHSDVNALFCVPHSVPFFLTLTLLLNKQIDQVAKMYDQYLHQRRKSNHVNILEAAESLISEQDLELINIEVEESILLAVTDLATQLVAQSLGSKQGDFNPRISVSAVKKPDERQPGVAKLSLGISGKAEDCIKLMLYMDQIALFVAMIAYHKDFNFVIHSEVNRYKQRAIELYSLARDRAPDLHQDGPTTSLSGLKDINTYLGANPAIRFIDVVYFGSSYGDSLSKLRDVVSSHIRQQEPPRSLSVTTYHGPQWMHSMYQAAVHMKNTLKLIVVEPSIHPEVRGISEQRLNLNSTWVGCFAQAIYETLAPASLYVQIGVEDEW